MMNFDTWIVRYLGHRAKALRIFTVLEWTRTASNNTVCTVPQSVRYHKLPPPNMPPAKSGHMACQANVYVCRSVVRADVERSTAARLPSHRNYSGDWGGRGGGGSVLAGVSSVGVAGPKESCDVTIVYNGKLKCLESCTLLNPFLFIENKRPFLSSEGFSTLEKMPWYVIRGQFCPSIWGDSPLQIVMSVWIQTKRAPNFLGRAWQASADNNGTPKGPLMNKKGLTYQRLIVTLAG